MNRVSDGKLAQAACADDLAIRNLALDVVDARAEIARLKQERNEATARAERAEARADAIAAQVEKLREALKPFAWIGQWFFARQEIPDDTPVMTFTGLHKPLDLTRGMFKAAYSASESIPRQPQPTGRDDGWQKGIDFDDTTEWDDDNCSLSESFEPIAQRCADTIEMPSAFGTFYGAMQTAARLTYEFHKRFTPPPTTAPASGGEDDAAEIR